MKGIVFNLLEEAVTEAFGEATWDDLVEAAGVASGHMSLGDYSDAEIAALVGAASKRLGKTPDEVLEWFGEAAMPLLKRRYPTLFEGHDSSRSFIMSVNSIIHPEVRKLYAGASCPFFHFKAGDGGSLTFKYQSTRSMFWLAVGFVRGAGKLWGDRLTLAFPEENVLAMAWS